MSAGEPAKKALWISTVAFTACFAVWTIFAIIGVRIKQELGLNEAEFGLLVGTPVLTGSLVRIVLGIWTGRYGGRLVYTLTMLAAAIGDLSCSPTPQTYTQMLIAGLGDRPRRRLLRSRCRLCLAVLPAGKAGNRARHLRCRQCRRGGDQVRGALRAHRMGLAGGCGDLGRSACADGNRLLVHDRPTTRPSAPAASRRVAAKSFLEEFAPLKNVQVWRFSLYYFFAFGGFVALSLWLPRYLVGVYGFNLETAGMIAAAYSIPGSILPRLSAACCPTRRARASVMYAMFAVSAVRHPHPLSAGCHRIGTGPAFGITPVTLHRRHLRARLLHEPRQGGCLQAHSGLLSRATSAQSAASSG